MILQKVLILNSWGRGAEIWGASKLRKEEDMKQIFFM